MTPEFEAELRSKVNPVYVDCRGTESYERAILLGEIDRLRALSTCACGDGFTEHDPGTCGNCVASMQMCAP